ncbi:thioester reductase domain-containing protein [Streptomyces sp. NPDC050617]|uniref:type I polyketide synthase n=1 Tax=Streptomyces sp. NPDC050617 TaxID=3154628 RepID=UPI003432454E
MTERDRDRAGAGAGAGNRAGNGAGAMDDRARLAHALDRIAQLRTRLEQYQQTDGPVAIVGMGCRFPGGADSPEAFWRVLADGADTVGRFPAERGDADAVYDPDPDAPGKAYCVEGGFIDRPDAFDAELFGISPAEATAMDPQQRITLEVVWEALERARIAPDRLAGSATGVFLGASTSDYARMRQQLSDAADVDAYQLMAEPAFLAGRVAYHFGLRGPAHVVDTACSSSLLAAHLACQSLRRGECDLALAGGVNLMLTPYGFVLVSKAGALAPDGRSKAFDASADGYARGEGCGVVVLKRLADALADGDPVVAVIHGSAVNHDGRSSGISVPSGQAQQEVIRAALADAGVAPARIGYVEAHGTGTLLGDPIELRALEAVLGAGRPVDQRVYVGSVKTNVGHLEAAAGAAGLMKLALALQHGRIPPSLHFDTPNPNVDWDRLHLTVPTAPTPWPAAPDGRRAGVSSFGVSGTNVHLVLGEAPPPPAAEPAPPVQSAARRSHELLVLSAASRAALGDLADRYAACLGLPADGGVAVSGDDFTGVGSAAVSGAADRGGRAEPPSEGVALGRGSGPAVVGSAADGGSLADVCRAAALGRAQLPYRASLVASSEGELRDRLVEFAGGSSAQGVVSGRAAPRRRAKVAFLFTGQGSQYPGMGRGLYDTEPAFRAALDECDALLRGRLDRPLLDVLYGGAQDTALLDRTAYTQPVLFAVEYALSRLWRSWGIRPGAVLGHSVGEYVAACVAGVFGLEDGLALVTARAALMQRLCEPGAMIAVPLTAAEAAHEAEADGGPIALAAVNGERECVLSGAADAVDRVAARLAGRGVRARRLRVSHAFHSPLVEPSLAELRATAARISCTAPSVPVISNLTGEAVGPDTLADPDYWCRHARSTVRFADGLRTLDRLGFTAFLEAGPGRTLLGLGATALPGPDRTWLASLRRTADDAEQVRTALGGLYVLGAPVDWQAVYAGDGGPAGSVDLPTYAFQRQRYWFQERAAAVAPAERTDRPDNETADAAPALLARLTETDPDARTGIVADRLLELLAAMLWTPAEEIAADADLLELGADSLLVMQVVTACKTELGLALSPRELFERPTVADWSALITERAERDHGLSGTAGRAAPAAAPDWTDTAVLRADAVLDPDIRPADVRREPGDSWRDPSDVLLTGATGFVGAFLLDELLRSTKATVHCLVRADDPETGLARLRAGAERYVSLRDGDEKRIVAVPGDLSRPLLGLGEDAFDALAHRVDAIYHNGANVNFIHSYRQLRAANVGGTQEVLRLACRGPLTPVSHVSTFGVWGVPEDLTSTFAEDDDLGRAGRLPNGYLQTKWAAERLVFAARERGVPVNIYRLGQIMGDSRRGACVTTSFTCAVIKGCIQFGTAPELDMLVEMTPADYVGRALVHASKTAGFGQNFHLLNPERITFDALVGYLQRRGWAVGRRPGPEWVAEFRAGVGLEDNALHPLIDTISEIVRAGQDSMTYRVDNLRRALDGSGISCPPLDDALLDTYFGWMVRTGFLPAPPAESVTAEAVTAGPVTAAAAAERPRTEQS